MCTRIDEGKPERTSEVPPAMTFSLSPSQILSQGIRGLCDLKPCDMLGTVYVPTIYPPREPILTAF